MQLNPGRFNDWIANIGQQVSWRQAHSCPCVSAVSGAAKVNCPVCMGKKVFWDPAVASVVGIAGQNVQRKWAQSGHWEDGDAVVSIPENSPMYDGGQYDRVLMLNNSERFSYVLTRGAPAERVFAGVLSITAVYWLSPGGVLPMIYGGTPTVNADGTLTWGAGLLAPAPGTVYTIEGTKSTEYFIYSNLPSSRNEHQGARLPKKVVLRSFDLFAR